MGGRVLASALLVLFAIVGAGCGDSAPSAETDQQQQAALARYESYLETNAAGLTRRVKTLQKTIDAGALSGTEGAYVYARIPYGHVDPAAQLLKPLAGRIDGLEEETLPSEFGGFHEIEKWVYWELETASMEPVVKRLRADVEELQRKIDATEFQPAEIVTGATAVLGRIVANDFPGNTERYAHSDLVDTAAKLEGVEAAFEGIKPLLEEDDPELAKQIEAQLREAFAKVGEYGTFARERHERTAGIGFIRYDQVTQGDKWRLFAPVKVLVGLFGEAEDELDAS